MEASILGEKQERWLAAVREQLATLRAALARFHAPAEDEQTVAESLRRLEELFLLVIVGEFNSGKSVFVNALLGRAVVEEGVVPTTSRIQVIQYGDNEGRRQLDPTTDVVTAPVDLLRQLHLVDTPGTNAIERQHEALTRDFIPRADLILFVTSADRPFTESERAFLSSIREWGKKVVLVVNKIDILETEEERRRVEQFVAESARKMLDAVPSVYPVAARQALRAKMHSDSEQMEHSRFAALESYIRDTLDETERVRLKLLNPLGVGERIVGKYLQGITEEEQVLRNDLKTVEEIEGQLAVYREDMERGFELRLAEVDNVVHSLEQRGHEFIEESVRLARVFELLDKDKMKQQFERQVVGDAPAEIERRVEGVIDWLVASDLRQWQVVRERLDERREQSASRLVGETNPQFQYNREQLMETVGRAAQRTFETYDQRREADRMADSLQAAVANTAMIEVGAVGLGAVVAMVATSTAVDVTGILAAGVMATLGFLVIPQRRRKAKKELRQKIGELREQLMAALNGQFRQEIERGVERLRNGISPYARFVRAEEKKLGEQREELTGIHAAIGKIRAEIEESRGTAG